MLKSGGSSDGIWALMIIVMLIAIGLILALTWPTA